MCSMRKAQVFLFCFSDGYPFDLLSFIEKTILCYKSSIPICMHLFLKTLFCSIALLVNSCFSTALFYLM